MKVYFDILPELATVSGAALKIIVAIAIHYDGHQCWPSITTLQQATGSSRHTVIRAVEELLQKQWIAAEKRPGKATVYAITTDYIEVFTSAKTAQDEDGLVQNLHRTSAKTAPVTSAKTAPEEDTIKEDTKKKEPSLDSSGSPGVEPTESQEGCPQCHKPKTDSSGVGYLMQKAHDLYREKFGECWTQSYSQGARFFKELLGLGKSDAAIIAVYRKYLEIDDPWYEEHGWRLAEFRTQYDGIRTRKSNGRHSTNSSASRARNDRDRDLDEYVEFVNQQNPGG